MLLNSTPTNASNSGNIHIYFIKNAVAEELAATLNSLLGSGASTSSQPARDTGATNTRSTVPRLPISTRGTNVGVSNAGVALEGQVKVVADKPTNSLVVRASASNYSALKKILERLDIPRRQVNVEATIMEIRIRDNETFNVAANIAVDGFTSAGGFIPTTMSASQFAAAATSPAALNGLIAGLPLGKKVDIKSADGTKTLYSISSFVGLIQAIQGLSVGQILQQPNILTSDNEPGTVNITEKIKVIGKTTLSSINDQAVQTTETETVPVELELKVTPQIGSDNELVKLKVEQVMEDFNKSGIVANQIDTIRRKATTVVVVRDGDTVVIGGLEKNDIKAQKSKVPLLGDLPIIGALFRGSDTEKIRSNLMLFLTPKIIDDNDRLLEFSQQQLQRRREVGKEAYDPKDYHRKDVSKLLKDTDERLKGKRGWGFKKNRSAFLSEDIRQPTRPSNNDDNSGTYRDEEGDGEVQAEVLESGPGSDLLPPPSDYDGADGLEPLDIQ
ncbi:MAG: secretin N-terminal domain-containing protein [Bdellovibrionota bacterium]